MAAETSRRIEGPTPAGGAYAIAYGQDAEGNPTTEAKAVMVEIDECTADGQSIMRTYGMVGGN